MLKSCAHPAVAFALLLGCGSSTGGGGGAATTLSVSPETASIAVGATQAFSVSAKDAGNNSVSASGAVWSSSNVSVASVDSTGIATGKTAGTADISARLGSLLATAHLTVTGAASNTKRLTVAKTGAGAGTVASAPAGVSCGATCAADFATGSTVVLTATAESGSVFAGWSGASCPGRGTCSVTLSTDTTVTANFATAAVLTMTVSGSGSIATADGGSCASGTCTRTYAAGDVAALTATPAGSFTFTGWSGACSSNGTCSITMSANQSVTATFAPVVITHTLTASVAGSGTGTITSNPTGISCPGTCSAAFSGTITLTATATGGSTFQGWSGACSGNSVTCSVPVNVDEVVTATFNPPVVQRTLTVSLSGAGSGSVTDDAGLLTCSGATCTGTYPTGTTVTLTAQPAGGSGFTSWGGACASAGAGTTCSLTLASNASASASFSLLPVTHTLSVSASGGSVTSSAGGINCPSTLCQATYPDHAQVTLTAAADAHYDFAGWSGGGCATANPCTVTLDSDLSVQATFQPRYTITVTVTGGGSVSSSPGSLTCASGVCSGEFAYNTSVTLTAAPANGAVFGSWSGDCAASAVNTCAVTTTQAVNAGVTFTAPATLTVLSGDNQTGALDQPVAAQVVLQLMSLGAPLTGATVTVAASAGAAASPGTYTTNAQGKVFVVPVLGLAAGQSTFSATGPSGAAATFHATAQAPAPGTLFTAVNSSHDQYNGTSRVPGPGTQAVPGRIYGLAVSRSTGTVYFSDYDSCVVRALHPDGSVKNVVGHDGQCGNAGDGGKATDAQMQYPAGLALDDDDQLLFVADKYYGVIRLVDLAGDSISTIAGGNNAAASPAWGDGGPALNAQLSQPGDLTFGSDGFLYIADTGHNRVRRVDFFGSQFITAFMGNATCGNTGVVDLAGCYGSTTGCSVAFDAQGSAFVSGYICDGAGNTTYGVLRKPVSGPAFLVAGKYLGTTTHGRQGAETNVGTPVSVAFDPAGSLYFTDYDHTVRKLDSASGMETLISGTAGTSGSTGDNGPAAGGKFNNPSQLAFDAANNLWIADGDNRSVRVIWALGSNTAAPATLSIPSGTLQTQSVRIDEVAAALKVKLVDAASAVLQQFDVTWEILTAGAAIPSTLTPTGTVTPNKGIAQITAARPGLTPGQAWQLRASFQDLHGAEVTGSPITFTINSTAPAAGLEFSALNAGQQTGRSLLPAPASTALTGPLTATAADAAGNLYVADLNNCQIIKVDTAGTATRAVGTGACQGSTGDGGQASEASIGQVRSMAIDKTNGILYFADGYDRVRLVDLATGEIELFAGGGTSNGVLGGPANAVLLTQVGGVAVLSDGTVLFNAYENGVGVVLYKVTTDQNINHFLQPTPSDCSAATVLSVNSIMQDSYGSNLAADGADNVYFHAYVCQGNGSTNFYYAAIVKRTAAGALSVVAGAFNGGSDSGSTIPALSANVNCVNQLVADATSLYFSEPCKNRVRKISGGNISTLSGDTSASGTAWTNAPADYLAASSIFLNQPWGVTLMPGGHLAFTDNSSSGPGTLRILW